MALTRDEIAMLADNMARLITYYGEEDVRDWLECDVDFIGVLHAKPQELLDSGINEALGE
jgi:hypothetical protein